MYGCAHIVGGARFYQETGGLRQEFFEKCRAEILPFSLDALPAHRNQARIHTERAQMPSVECGMSKEMTKSECRIRDIHVIRGSQAFASCAFVSIRS